MVLVFLCLSRVALESDPGERVNLKPSKSHRLAEGL